MGVSEAGEWVRGWGGVGWGGGVVSQGTGVLTESTAVSSPPSSCAWSAAALQAPAARACPSLHALHALRHLVERVDGAGAFLV